MNATVACDRLQDDAVPVDVVPEVLASILRPEVSLAIWDRTPPFTVPAGALDGFESIRFTAVCHAVAAHARAMLDGRSTWQRKLAADAGMLAMHFGEIMGADTLDVRIERVSGNACRKVHADYVTARLITTSAGRGTEWFDDDPVPVLRGQLATGAVGLFKGRTWAPDTAILHRSPPIVGTGEQRLLLVMDPARP